MGGRRAPPPRIRMHAAFVLCGLSGASAALVQQSGLHAKSANVRSAVSPQMRKRDVVINAFKSVKGMFGEKKQDFLEADPYWDQSTVPVNTYKNKSPFVGKIMSVKR